jgi:hypothetical protein
MAVHIRRPLAAKRVGELLADVRAEDDDREPTPSRERPGVPPMTRAHHDKRRDDGAGESAAM